MPKKLFFTIILAAVVISSVFILKNNGSDAYSSQNPQLDLGAVNREKCGTMEYLETLYQQDPAYKERMKHLEEYARKYISEHPHEKDSRGVIIIPCVVHVVWNTPIQNISDDQVLSQIDVLNNDFRRWNADTVNTPAPFKPLGADCMIEFRIARRDPNNSPTLGITRTQTSIVEFGQSSAVKFTSQGGHDAWDRDKYLNLWACNLGAGLLGYATFPGGNPQTDGVVIGYNYFGTVGTLSPPFHKGRTATHEVGHWLWLYHIWGDDGGSCAVDDNVADTPLQGGEIYGCPSYPRLDNCSPVSPGIMFMNYMDYSDDACMNIFTWGQLDRMNAAINGPRLPLQTSNGHINVSGTPLCSFRADSISILYGQPLQFRDISAGIPTSWQWTFTGGNPPSSTQQNPVVTYITPGYYTVKLRISNSFGTDSLTRVNYIKVRGAAMNQFTIVSPPALTRITVAAGDTSRVHFTWTKSSTNPTVNYKIRINKVGTQVFYSFPSNSSGVDSVASIRKSTLDSLAAIMGPTGDSVRCAWRSWAFNGVDSLASVNSFLITLVRSTIGINIISTEVPGNFALYTNYPNPFNPVTKIKFDIPNITEDNFVKLTVYDILGKEISVLVNQNLKAGKYEADWDAANYPSGIYFYRISAAGFTQTRRMVLVK